MTSARHRLAAPAHPWKRTARTTVQVTLGLAVAAPLIYEAATNADPASATGAAGLGLAIAAGVARVMALPAVEVALRAVAPWLSASDVPAGEVVAQVDPGSRFGRIVAGPASASETGSPVTVTRIRT